MPDDVSPAAAPSVLAGKPRLKTASILLLAGMAVVLVVLMVRVLPPGIDWHNTYRPTALRLLQGQSPYAIQPLNPDGSEPDRFYNAPWVLLPMLPLALLPEAVGRALWALISMAAFAWTAHRMGGKPAAVALVLLSPLVLHCVLNGSVDGVVVLGLALPPQIGLIFLAIKPQVGSVVALFWLVEAWRLGGWRELLRVAAPVSVLMLISFALFGVWPLGSLRLARAALNASLWPVSIPVGLALAVAAFRTRRVEYACAASPCLSPYLLFYSWIGVLLAVVRSLPETAAAVAGLWILTGLRALGM